VKSPPIISVRGLHKQYPVIKGFRELILNPFSRKKVVALEGVNLDVSGGSCFCLLGPNGAGKTTLIKVLSTLVLPDRGDAYVDGCHVEREADKVKRSIGYAIGDERSFYWRLSGRQNLEFFASLNNIPPNRLKSRIEEMLCLTNLAAVADLRFNTYSTGMRQMLSFARALLTDARVLFVDEPTRSLDPVAAHKIRTFLRRELVDRQKRTVFWATHNLAEAAGFAHELAVIDQGKIKLSGSLADLTDNGRISLENLYEEAVGVHALRPDLPKDTADGL
jgi:ABC-2 type transport system ATP-binding protein